MIKYQSADLVSKIANKPSTVSKCEGGGILTNHYLNTNICVDDQVALSIYVHVLLENPAHGFRWTL